MPKILKNFFKGTFYAFIGGMGIVIICILIGVLGGLLNVLFGLEKEVALTASALIWIAIVMGGLYAIIED